MSLYETASVQELIRLCYNEDIYVKTYAVAALVNKKEKTDYYKILSDNFCDDRNMLVMDLDRGWHMEVWRFFYITTNNILTKDEKESIEDRILEDNRKALMCLDVIRNNYKDILNKAKEMPLNNHYDSLLMSLLKVEWTSAEEIMLHLSDRYFNEWYDCVMDTSRMTFIYDLFDNDYESFEAEKELLLLQIKIIIQKDEPAGLKLLDRYLKTGYPKFYPDLANLASPYSIDTYSICMERIINEESPYYLIELVDYIYNRSNKEQKNNIKKIIENKIEEIGYYDIDLEEINKILKKF